MPEVPPGFPQGGKTGAEPDRPEKDRGRPDQSSEIVVFSVSSTSRSYSAGVMLGAKK